MNHPNNIDKNYHMNNICYMDDINNDSFDDIINELYSLEDSFKEKDINKNKTNTLQWCRDCNDNNIIINSAKGYFSCGTCGENLGHFVDTSSNYIDMDDKHSSNQGTILVSKSLPETTSQIIIKGMYNNNIRRLQNWNSISYKEKKLNDVFRTIQNACSLKNIYKCVEDTAKIMYKQIYDNKKDNEKNTIFRGLNYKSLIASCLFMACKTNNYIISMKEIALLFELKKTDMKRGMKIFKNLSKQKKFNLKITINKPEDFIKGCFEKININKCFFDQTIQLVMNIQKIQIANSHTPISIAIGAIYLVIYMNNVNISKKELSRIFDISQVTIKKTFNKLEPFINILLNDKVCDLLQFEIKKYQVCIEYDLVYIADCIKFNVKYDFKKLLDYDIEFQKKVIIIQDIELMNKKILNDNMELKIKLNHTLINYKCMECYI